jgi:predicted PurR-regulated permease PerM
MPYGIIIGFITGYSFLIPYVGIGVASLFGVLFTISHMTDFSTLIGIFLVYAIGQVIESFFLTPRITGNKVGLDPFITIIAIIVGANLMGVLGVLIVIPITGILKYYYIRIKGAYRISNFFVKE